ALDPAETLQSMPKRCQTDVSIGVIGSRDGEYADAAHALALLRPRVKGPRRRRAAEQRHELPSPHAHPPVKAHTAGLVSIASRVFLHFLQLPLSLNRLRANPISESHVSQSKRQQCSCDTRCRAPNGNLRSAIRHLPVIVRSRHRPSLYPERPSRRFTVDQT